MGYHILKVTAKRSAQTLDYKKAESDIEKLLLEQKRKKYMNKIINNNKKKFPVVYK